MDFATIKTVIEIITALFVAIGFVIKVFTGVEPEKALHKMMRRPTNHQPQPSPPDPAGVNLPQYPPPPPAQPSPTPGWSLHRLIPPHPWLFGVSLLSLILLIVISESNLPSDSYWYTDLGFAIIGIGIAGVVMAARGRNWVWLIVIILTVGYAVFFFSIFARPKKRVSPYPAGIGEAPTQQPYQQLPQYPPPNQQRPLSPWSATLKGAQQSLELGSSTVNIGRSTRNQLILNDLQASKFHAQIYSQGQNHIVMDLGSANGTFVNEQRLIPSTPHPLKMGDRVRFAQTAFTYTRSWSP